MDFAHPSKASGQYHTSSSDLESTRKEKSRPGAAIWRPKQRDRVTPGDNLRGWPRIGTPRELLWAAYASVGAKVNGGDDADDGMLVTDIE